MFLFFTPDYIYKELSTALDKDVRSVWDDRSLYTTTGELARNSITSYETYELTRRSDGFVEVIYLVRFDGKFLYANGKCYDFDSYEVRAVII